MKAEDLRRIQEETRAEEENVRKEKEQLKKLNEEVDVLTRHPLPFSSGDEFEYKGKRIRVVGVDLFDEKKVEYRDFTEYNIKRTIGLKTVRFNRGYGSKGRPPKQMKWGVEKVVLLNCDDNECDPFNVPEGFLPTTIAIHLGKRIA